ncbi:hypothetical protein Poli38472_012660 [Pythium oligandrum]|uniref:NmrA-like domain-containing protein n=1 Tax=Pythium oligandrum TaxID=41045 RepID=A0A8K1FHX1_PYTOL|nr:hypothetical protein Poli38472_012660 [Pythium oligandrum]|eukprot:TMW61469.1 hypothetical protein Poli38472_012660 [Pythium oligandrum]
MPATTSSTATLLVTGASGKLGKAVVQHLLDTVQVDPSRIVAGTRTPDKLSHFAERGVQVRHLDFNDAATVSTVALGVDRVLLICSDDVVGRLTTQKKAVEAFVEAGVQHILYTSLQALDKTLFKVGDDHRAMEEAIKESKVPGYTFLRNGLYYENNFGPIAGAKKQGKWMTAAKDGKLSAISRDDLARANAFALASDNYENQMYELTGPEALTIDEFVGHISELLKISIDVVQISEDELAQMISVMTGWPVEACKILSSLDVTIAAGRASDITDDYEKLTGVKAQTHREWLEASKAILEAL